MGLSGRKVKQRIGADPRNLTWADNAAKFGQAYLSKLGWDPSKGLGTNQDGRTSHIKVAQKLNMLGLGAGAPQGPDAIAWKQNRDYETLLKRLNESNGPEEIGGDDGKEETGVEVEVGVGQKRKREVGDKTTVDADDEKREKKKGRKERKERKEKKKSRSTSATSESTEKDEKMSEDTSSDTTKDAEKSQSETPSVSAPRRHLAHRARFLRSKQLASQSSAAVAEILGISPSVSGTATPTLVEVSPPSTLAPISGDESVKMEQLTTATKSVADYFKEKLAAKSRSGTTTPTAVAVATALPSTHPDHVDQEQERETADRGKDEFPLRSGIGIRRLAGDDEEPLKMGLGSGMKFGNLMGNLRMGFDSIATSTPAAPLLENDVKADQLDEPIREKGEKEKKRKEKKDKKKDKDKKGKGPETPEQVSVGNEQKQSEILPDAEAFEDEKSQKEAKKKDKKERKEKKRKEKKRKDKSSS